MIDILFFDKLIKTICNLKNEEECRLFFEDLCTIQELKEMSQRLETASLLNKGESYQQIIDKVGTSTATISRVNRCLLYGPGGYKNALKNEDYNGN